jgi:c-di-GMP-binding flagellar brake protein YcgR
MENFLLREPESRSIQKGVLPGEEVDPLEQRRYRRISVGRDHTVRFRFRGQNLDSLPITSLSASGCFVILPGEFAEKVREGLLLVNFVLEHEDLPSSPICAQIVRVVTCLAEISTEDVGLGLLFLSTSDRFTEQVDTYVSAYHEVHVGVEP